MDWLLPIKPAAGAPGTFEVTPHSTQLGRYGSFLMGCAVRAAAQTVEAMALTSLRADFLTPPSEGPIVVDVEDTRTGRAAAVRRVRIRQEKVHAVVALSFAPEYEHPAEQAAADPVVAPTMAEEDPTSLTPHVENAAGIAQLDIRPLVPAPGGFVARHPFWARPSEPFGEGAEAAAAAVVLATDHFVTALASPDEETPEYAVTMDHSVWILRPIRADEWYRHDASRRSTGGGRSVLEGQVTDPAGRLVATFVQQAMLRGPLPSVPVPS